MPLDFGTDCKKGNWLACVNNLLTARHTDLISSVVHLHVVPVHVQLHVLVAEHGGRLGVSVVTSHVISQHENYVAGERENNRALNMTTLENKVMLHLS